MVFFTINIIIHLKKFFLIHSLKVLRDLSFEETIGFLIGQLILKFDHSKQFLFH